jgi:hypothetical protein
VEVGLLWYDDSQIDFAKKVLEAAERYQEKSGARPNRCYVNPECLPEDRVAADGIKILASPIVLPNHFWVGVAKNGNCKRRSSRRHRR